MSHRASLLGRGYQDNHLDSPRVRFRRALLLCLMTVIVPGSGHIAVGKRAVGWFAVTLWVGVLGGGGFLLWKYRTDRAEVLSWFTDTDVLLLARAGIVAIAVLWGILFLDAWRLASPFRLNFMRAAFITVLNLAIIAGVAGSTAYASQLIKVSRDTVKVVFKATETSEPLKGRYNILLLGSDSGKDRVGIRPDSMTVASIDADTGKVVLISLPRNLQNVPFSEGSPMRKLYPNGYNCGSVVPAQRRAHGRAESHGPLSRQQRSGARRHDRCDPGRHEPQDQLLHHGQHARIPRTRGCRRWGHDRRQDPYRDVRPRGLVEGPLDRARQAEAQRHQGPLVHPQPRAVRRLHPHGSAEVHDGRDGRPAQPAECADSTPPISRIRARSCSAPTSRNRSSASSWTLHSRRAVRRSARCRSCRRSSTR